MLRAGSPANKVLAVAAMVAVVVLAMALLLAAPGGQSSSGTILTRAFFNALHVPLFVVLAHIGWLLTRSLTATLPARATLWLSALLALAAGSEWLQQWTGRSASTSDLLRNMAGIAAWLGGFVYLYGRGPWRIAGALLAAVTLALGLGGFAHAAASYVQRNAAAPLLFAPDRSFSRFFTRISDNVRWQPDHLHIQPAGRRWNVHMDEPFPDWGGRRLLCLEWTSSGSFDVSLRIHDWAHNQDHHDRFNVRLRPLRARHVEAIRLADVAAAPRDRSLELERVAGVVIFGAAQTSGWLRIHRIWLSDDDCEVVVTLPSGTPVDSVN